jgi:hypothetical protein
LTVTFGATVVLELELDGGVLEPPLPLGWLMVLELELELGALLEPVLERSFWMVVLEDDDEPAGGVAGTTVVLLSLRDAPRLASGPRSQP